MMAAATETDMSILATDTTLGNRISEALALFCWSTVPGEAITAATLPQHVARKQLAANVLNNPTTYKPLFILAVSSNQIVANDATTNGTLVGLTQTQVATAAAAVLDTDINNAIAAAFNAFVANI